MENIFIRHGEVRHKVYSLMKAIKSGELKGKAKFKAKNKVIALMKALEKLDKQCHEEIKKADDHQMGHSEN